MGWFSSTAATAATGVPSLDEVATQGLQDLIKSRITAKDEGRDHLNSQNGIYAVWLAKKLGIDFPKPSWTKDTLLPMLLAGAAALGLGTAIPLALSTVATALKPDPVTPAPPVLDAPPVTLPPVEPGAEVQMSLPAKINQEYVKALGN